MTDNRTPDDLPVGNVDASGEAMDVDGLIHPEQPTMDDAAGPQDENDDVDETSTEDLSVQGGE